MTFDFYMKPFLHELCVLCAGLLKVAELLKVKGLVEEERERLLSAKGGSDRRSGASANPPGDVEQAEHKLNGGGDHHGDRDYSRGRSSRQSDHHSQHHRSQEREKDLQDARADRHREPRARTPSDRPDDRDRSSSRDNHRYRKDASILTHFVEVYLVPCI